ncbi:MAG: hypothetical protein JKY15_01110 [Deltaproteobacteria bacterium]|nr:hypothetical protein [Deltaproteobacteria bacterium]
MRYLTLFVFSVSLLANYEPSRSEVASAANLASAVYQESPKAHLPVIQMHENPDFANRLVAYLDKQHKTLYIVVRGTTELRNWIANLSIGYNDPVIGSIADMGAHMAIDMTVNALIPTNYQQDISKNLKSTYKGLKSAHDNFFIDAFQDLRKASEAIILQYPTHKVVFVGHSYGGIMGNLLAQQTIYNNPELNVLCHTFNAPGAREIRSKILRLPTLNESFLNQHFFNHFRWSDPVSKISPQEGRIYVYQAGDNLLDPIGQHEIGSFADELIGQV